MALKWLLSSAFTQVFGHTDSFNLQQKDIAAACPTTSTAEGLIHANIKISKEDYPNGFQMPLHYPRYTKADYEKMEDWKLDMLLKQYGLNFHGTVDEKRSFAMGSFLWPDQL